MFGSAPSFAAIKSVETFKKEKLTNILELGGGQGRDSLFFAQNNFCVQVLDYSKSGVDNIIKQANILGLAKRITVNIHDVRKPLPFRDESFDGCFSHMLYCMAFTTKELKNLSNEIHRVLKPGGINIYTAYCWTGGYATVHSSRCSLRSVTCRHQRYTRCLVCESVSGYDA